ncbi:hypothetical protein K439DRAFT_32153 [Ramaria rubella]|nr:hypothetical protein K439DRAFT_32153 [Ramaria rubella]
MTRIEYSVCLPYEALSLVPQTQICTEWLVGVCSPMQSSSRCLFGLHVSCSNLIFPCSLCCSSTHAVSMSVLSGLPAYSRTRAPSTLNLCARPVIHSNSNSNSVPHVTRFHPHSTDACRRRLRAPSSLCRMTVTCRRPQTTMRMYVFHSTGVSGRALLLRILSINVSQNPHPTTFRIPSRCLFRPRSSWQMRASVTRCDANFHVSISSSPFPRPDLLEKWLQQQAATIDSPSDPRNVALYLPLPSSIDSSAHVIRVATLLSHPKPISIQSANWSATSDSRRT